MAHGIYRRDSGLIPRRQVVCLGTNRKGLNCRRVANPCPRRSQNADAISCAVPSCIGNPPGKGNWDRPFSPTRKRKRYHLKASRLGDRAAGRHVNWGHGFRSRQFECQETSCGSRESLFTRETMAYKAVMCPWACKGFGKPSRPMKFHALFPRTEQETGPRFRCSQATAKCAKETTLETGPFMLQTLFPLRH